MSLTDAIIAAGMTPPNSIAPGRWVRFPGNGKSRANRSGWCRVISPTLAIFGDWSTGLTEVWRDDTHRDDFESRRLLSESRQREAAFRVQTRRRQERSAQEAARLIKRAVTATHPYLARKGFPAITGLVHDNKLVVPMRDGRQYDKVLSAQLIATDGEKKFLPGGKASGAVFRLGVQPVQARHVVLCEGYATGLSIQAALSKLPGPSTVIVCFSARNLEVIAEFFPLAVVAADNDLSATGEHAAIRTGLKWTMPYEVATDFNDLHQRMGLHVVVDRMRDLLSR